MLGGLATLTGQFDESIAGEILYQVSGRFQDMGQAGLAAEVLHALVRDHPAHPLTEAALLDLVRYYSSSEIQWRHRAPMGVAAGQTDPAGPPQPSPGAVGAQGELRGLDALAAAAKALEADAVQADAVQADAVQADAVQAETAPARPGGAQGGGDDQAWSGIVALENEVRSRRPQLFAQPAVRLALLSAYRAHGRAAEARKYYQSVLASAPSPSWRTCVLGEVWLEGRRDEPPVRTLRCPLALQRPRLDGQLDDPVWQTTETAVLGSPRSDDAAWPAVVWLAHDRQFLYLAARCEKAAAAAYPAERLPRPRSRSGFAGSHRALSGRQSRLLQLVAAGRGLPRLDW